MNGDYRALPLSRREIVEEARKFRTALGLETCKALPMVGILEHAMPLLFEGFNYIIVPESEMQGREAETYPLSNEIAIREDTYCRLCHDDPHARFTIGHEIGHYVLHTPEKISLAFEDEAARPPRPFESPEWQANVFAGELLAPARMVVGMTVEAIINQFKVSKVVAQKQANLAFSLNQFGHCGLREPFLPGFQLP